MSVIDARIIEGDLDVGRVDVYLCRLRSLVAVNVFRFDPLATLRQFKSKATSLISSGLYPMIATASRPLLLPAPESVGIPLIRSRQGTIRELRNPARANTIPISLRRWGSVEVSL